ncbi:hypothetical protein [Burkholderia ubonensis]|uniref:hypothetical protein n=1 Tax=Burkholderia ubonensis TaxID=101571 RepID=UPI0007581749|nr:hypothetical protein [Burkholderia ubonensis]KVT62193.1 hypothetical protein WK54_07750 [Burkholderia ubonensis]
MDDTWVQTLVWRKPDLGVPNFVDRVLVIVGGQIQIADIEFGVFFDHHTGQQLGSVQWWAEFKYVLSIHTQEQTA